MRSHSHCGGQRDFDTIEGWLRNWLSTSIPAANGGVPGPSTQQEIAMSNDAAEIGKLQALLSQIGAGLDEFLKFEHPDALHPGQRWRAHLDIPLPRQGIG